VVWPNPPTGLPSFDPSQIPPHPELPDLNYGIWSWAQNGDMVERCFVPYPLYVNNPVYNPALPPEEHQPGNWVVVLFGTSQFVWGWIPTEADSGGGTPPDSGGGSEPHPDHTLPGPDLPYPEPVT
jgi:hypothetical protein